MLALVGCATAGPRPTPPQPQSPPALNPPAPPPLAAPSAIQPAATVDAAEAARSYASHQTFLGSGLAGPNGLALDEAGNLYEADYYRGTVTQVAPSGATRTWAGGFSGPAGLAFDPAGNLLVACYETHTLERIPPGGGSKSVWISSGLRHPVWPAVDHRGTLYLADYDNNRIARVAPDGSLSTFVSIPGVNSIAVAPDDTLWVTTWGGTVDRVTPSGGRSTLATGLYSADGIAWSPSYLAVVQYGGEHSSDGRLVLVDYAGRAYPVQDRLDKSSSVIFDRSGTVYTADCGDTALRMYRLR
jgi:hypothetical protein